MKTNKLITSNTKNPKVSEAEASIFAYRKTDPFDSHLEIIKSYKYSQVPEFSVIGIIKSNITDLSKPRRLTCAFTVPNKYASEELLGTLMEYHDFDVCGLEDNEDYNDLTVSAIKEITFNILEETLNIVKEEAGKCDCKLYNYTFELDSDKLV